MIFAAANVIEPVLKIRNAESSMKSEQLKEDFVMAKRGGFPGGGMPGNMANIMKQAQKMQRQMEEGQKELEVKEFSAKSGGGAVEAVVNGKKELVKLTISEEAVDPEDVEMLQDMIVAAVNEAMKQADEASQELMGKMTGGLGGGFPF